ncbi:hypothetical protein GKZ89_19635 [Bacillus mangrovi]|uniref:YwdI family protein n=1 Tax=Metabacillus mangrovi TaxID=1491830 RepID=A0A7X2S8F1_9BACI|nr:YwdI family protein [Metabacillus mangrovi]MTH55609.1 hypothetical protein [Metabacillus mangrovi]
MDISIRQLLSKMEAELEQARRTESDHVIREKLLVIKTLCDLVLDQEPNREPAPLKKAAQNGIDQYELQKMMGASKPVPSKPAEDRLKEDGANGDSLFDF